MKLKDQISQLQKMKNNGIMNCIWFDKHGGISVQHIDTVLVQLKRI